MKYSRFFAMTATSTLVMFGLTYLNTYALDHIYFSDTRTHIEIYAGAAWLLLCYPSCSTCIKNKKINKLIFTGSLIIIAGTVLSSRSQDTVHDESLMSDMITRHSTAILTSERATTDDVRVRELANGIIKA